jgi:pimeloyl-ACP methyl ester carboxylesterase
MGDVISKDGTNIAFDKTGQGSPIILVDGAMCSRTFGPMTPLAALLASDFTVFTYDRRGRGESGDTAPYTKEREIEDIAALIKAAGESAFVYGTSSGAVVALTAAAHNIGITKLVLYEPPFVLDDTRPAVPVDYLTQQANLLSSGQRGDMVELFMTKGVGIPPEYVAGMRQQPFWSSMEGVAHTLIYDGMFMTEGQQGSSLPTELSKQMASISVSTLVMNGGASPSWLHNAAQTTANNIPNAQYRIVEGQTHEVAAEAIAPVLKEWFS